MHTRRVATFILGVWIGCSLFMGFVALQNLHSVDLVMNSPVAPAEKMIHALGRDQAELLLRHYSSEQNRHYFYLWEQAEMVLGVALGACLYMATQKRILPITLCGIMLALVVFQHVGITPELAYRGRETDFPPGNTAFGAMARLWALNQVFVGTEAVKLVVGGILASYLFVFRIRTRRSSSRKEFDIVNDPDRSHIDR